MVLCVIVVGGGELVPLSTRDQFSPAPSGVSIDSPLYINENAYDAGMWASVHMDPSEQIWGDYLAYSVFGGFAHFEMVWDSYAMFANTTFNATLLARVFVGQYARPRRAHDDALPPTVVLRPQQRPAARGDPGAELGEVLEPVRLRIALLQPGLLGLPDREYPPRGDELGGGAGRPSPLVGSDSGRHRSPLPAWAPAGMNPPSAP